jgi:hypothetical protein
VVSYGLGLGQLQAPVAGSFLFAKLVYSFPTDH